MPGPIPGVAAHLKILIVTDAWRPQVNGVVRTLEVLGEDLTALGHDGALCHARRPLHRRAAHLSRNPAGAVSPRQLEKEIRDFAPDAVHIATEGTLGHERARHLPQVRHRILHLVPHPLSRICAGALSPDAGRVGLSLAALVSRPRHRDDGGDRKPEARDGGAWLSPICASGRAAWMWSISIPSPGAHLPYEGPIWLYVGRVAVEKNIEAFLALDLPGTKVVVGDGPARAALEAKYPGSALPGRAVGRGPGRAYAGSDVFVFPSRTDTFGLVLLEAWPAAFRWPPIRSRGRWMWWADAARGGPGRGPESGLPEGPGDRPPPRRPDPPGLRPGPFLAGLHPAIPAQYHGRAGRALSQVKRLTRQDT